MKKNKLMTVSLLFVSIFISSELYSYSPEKILDQEKYSNLIEKGKLERTFYNKKNVSLILYPATQLAYKAVKSWPAEKDEPIYVAEELFMLNKKDLGTGDVSKVTINEASKIIRSVSKMEGMEYYSHSDKKTEVLYKDCYCIKGPNDRTRVPDDLYGSADGKIMYCFQNDNSFGKINYRLEYHQTDNEVSATFINTTPIYMGFVKAIDSDNLRINVVITDCEDKMLVYMLVQADLPALAIFENTMNESFGSRLDAIYKWFVQQF
ncbi:MAG: DUF6675 family protein [Treponema sp.]